MQDAGGRDNATQVPAPNDAFLAEMIRLGARAIASDAAQRLLDSRAEIAHRFGDVAFTHWQGFLVSRLLELASAIDLRAPELFAHDAAWSRASFEARDVPIEDLRAAFGALEAALVERVKSASGIHAHFEHARLALSGALPTPERLGPATPHVRVVAAYLHEAINARKREAIGVLLRALDDGIPLASILIDVIIPAQREIGAMWHAGEISVPEEHIATDTTRAALGVLAHLAPPAPSLERTILVAAVEGDHHDVGVRVASDLLELAGFRAACLGANVPAEDIAQAVHDFAADLVALSAAMSVHLPALRRSIDAVRASRQHPPRILVGGAIFRHLPSLGVKVGADACVPRLDAIVEAARELCP